MSIEPRSGQIYKRSHSIHVLTVGRVIQGERHNGSSVLGNESLHILEAGGLLNNWSAQTCELYALNQALKMLTGKEGMLYTNSKYTFGIIHTFGKIWMERGLIYSKGRYIVHKELITQVLDNLMMPEEIAIAHIKGGEPWKPGETG